jgi:hypothetical protein
MKIPARNYLSALGLVTLLMISAPRSSFAQHQNEAGSGNAYLSQYCVPHDDENQDAQRVYC